MEKGSRVQEGAGAFLPDGVVRGSYEGVDLLGGDAEVPVPAGAFAPRDGGGGGTRRETPGGGLAKLPPMKLLRDAALDACITGPCLTATGGVSEVDVEGVKVSLRDASEPSALGEATALPGSAGSAIESSSRPKLDVDGSASSRPSALTANDVAMAAAPSFGAVVGTEREWDEECSIRRSSLSDASRLASFMAWMYEGSPR